MTFAVLLCLSLCVTCAFAIPPNQGTGKNCVSANGGPGGPKCSARQIGLCCDPTRTYDNCQPANGEICSTSPCYGQPQCLTAFCCDEMDLLGCYTAADPNGCVGDFNPFCCARAGTVKQIIDGTTHDGGLDCLFAGDAGCKSRPHNYCC